MITEATYASIAERRLAFMGGLRPDPLQTVAQWADERLHLPSFAPVPGQWRTSRTPFLKEIMECLSPRHRCRKVVFMKPVQIGGTQVAVNWVGYTMDRSPTAMLFYEPIIDMAKRLTKEKLDPVIQATPTLRGKVREARSRDSGNTTYRKEFLGGFLNILWANSSAGSRSTSAPRIVVDEVDEYEQDVGDQGHPCDLIEKRAAAYARYKIFELSTPTLEATSRIEPDYQLGSQGRYHVPCPFCGHYQHLVWDRLIYTFDGVTRPDDAAYQCESCEQLIAESYKTWMMDIARAKWVHAYPERVEAVASFHINLLYQPSGWAYPWSRLAKEYIKAYEKMKAGDVRAMKTFRNTILAETWKEKIEKLEYQSMYDRREIYEADVPQGVLFLTAAVDVQDNRLEAEIIGWGIGEESWCIDYRIFNGSPSLPTVWLQLTEWLQKPMRHACGKDMKVESVGVDTGGHHTKDAYKFIESYRGEIFALKGSSQPGAPPTPRRKPEKHREYNLHLYIIGTNAMKDTIFGRLKIENPGPGFMHFPRRDGYDHEYFEGLTSEVKKPKYKPKSHVKIGYFYEKTRDRNEPLDLKVYNIAAFALFNPKMKRRASDLAAYVPELPLQITAEASSDPQPVEENPQEFTPEPPEKTSFITKHQPNPRRRGGFVKGWR
jgi:phage terminase large subunit GpA-like protein